MFSQLLAALLLAAACSAENWGADEPPKDAPAPVTPAPIPVTPSPSTSDAPISIPPSIPIPKPSSPSTTQTSSSGAIKAKGFTWGESTIRGVNTGGWLVLEPWITPSLFVDKPDWVVDEWTFGKHSELLGISARKEITRHWDTWITYFDFESMASVGLNTVRIPIGFWALIPLLDEEPYLVGAFDYLKRAVRWASQLGLKVIVDLHGMPSGQNGWDNSGHRDVKEWFNSTSSFDRSIAAINVIVTEFIKPEYSNTVAGIDIANQPMAFTMEEQIRLKKYVEEAYKAIRKVSVPTDQGAGITIMVTDASLGTKTWGDLLPYPEFERVAIDYHVKPMHNSSLVSMSYDEHLRWTCNLRDELVDSNNRLWTVVGEFTATSNDCAQWLNGRGRGARYDNSLDGVEDIRHPGNCQHRTGEPKTWSAEYTTHLARSFETQTWVYEQGSGWIYWTWKTEKAQEWSFVSGLTYGWIPTPITDKPHGMPCLYTCGWGVRVSPAVSVVVGAVVLAVMM